MKVMNRKKCNYHLKEHISHVLKFTFLVISLMISNHSFAEGVIIKDWEIQISEEVIETHTQNSSNSSFGFICPKDGCYFYLEPQISCNQGSKLPMLVNSESGSTFVLSRCISVLNGNKHILIIDDKDVVKAVSIGQRIGFAIAIEGGEFKVLRFSLRGATDAISQAAAIFKTRRMSESDETL